MKVRRNKNKNDDDGDNANAAAATTSNLQHLTIQLRHARAYSYFSDPAWSFCIKVVQMIGHNNSLKTLTRLIYMYVSVGLKQN